MASANVHILMLNTGAIDMIYQNRAVVGQVLGRRERAGTFKNEGKYSMRETAAENVAVELFKC